MKDYRDEAQDKDWERISELLRKADCVPEAPDCRSAVMARVSKPRPVRRLAWAYGLALAMLAVVAVGTRPFLTHTGGQTSRVAVVAPVKGAAPTPTVKTETQPDEVALFDSAPPTRHRVSRVRREKPVLVAMAPPSVTDETESTPAKSEMGDLKADSSDRLAVKVLDAIADVPKPAESVSAGLAFATPAKDKADLSFAGSFRRLREPDSSVLDWSDARATGASEDKMAAAPPARVGGAFRAASSGARSAFADGLETVAAAPAAVGGDFYYDSTSRPASRSEDDKRPVAVAVVTWPSASNSTDNSYSYGYTDRNTSTGETTECRVKRTGDSVEIYLESKPGPGDAPVKGSLDHESVPNA